MAERAFAAIENARADLAPALDYIARHEQIQDVLLSGGDPLLLTRERLREILSRLREIKHVQIIRIGSRVPCALPSRITPELAGMLSEFHPLFVNIHFNHPAELTADSERACAILANAGIPLGSQTVLLRGVNDSEAVLAELFHRLLSIRVRPYYLMQMDLTRSTAHFRTPISTGLQNSSQTSKPDFRAGDAPFRRRSAGWARENAAPAQYDPRNRQREYDRQKLPGRIVPLPAS